MPSNVDVFLSFRNPYSYLAASRLTKISNSYDIDVRFRPVLPMAIRVPDRFANPQAGRRDAGARTCPRGRNFAVIWNGKTKDWDRGKHLTHASARAGLDLDRLEAAIAADVARYDQVIATNGAALEDAGHWGVPTCVFEGEPFFGQDRLDILCWRLDQRGLARS